MTRTYAPRGAHIARVITNRYPGTCGLCRNRVEAEAGVAFRDDAGGKWQTQHKAGECPPPAAPVTAKVYTKPDLGYYVRNDGALIKVQASKRLDDDGTPRHYGLVFTRHDPERPTWDFVKGAGASVADLRPMTAHDAALMGLASGYCVNCCAKLGPKDPTKPTLSSLVAARIGYGSTCAKVNGWPFPETVAAQRAFLA